MIQAVGPYPMMYIHNDDIAYDSIKLLLYNAIVSHCMTPYSNLMLFFVVTQIQNADKV